MWLGQENQFWIPVFDMNNMIDKWVGLKTKALPFELIQGLDLSVTVKG